MIIGFAVRTAVSLEEISSAEFLVAMSAYEMLRMPRLTESGDNLADDWLIAGGAATLLGSGDSLPVHIGLERSQYTV